MSVAIADVPMWCHLPGRGMKLEKTGHVLVWAEGGGCWATTLCGTLSSGHTKTKQKPTRVCPKCRALLPHVNLSKETT